MNDKNEDTFDIGNFQVRRNSNPKIESADDGEKIKTMEIKLNQLIGFRNHPFKTYEGERLELLKESIKYNGLIAPIVVRPLSDGKYEILSGHNRVKALELLQCENVQAIIKDGLFDEQAMQIVIESNMNQQSFNDWSYSQQIRLIKLYSKYIADNSQQGKRSDLEEREEVSTCDHNAHKSKGKPRPKTRDKISRQLGISATTFSRYKSIAQCEEAVSEKLGEFLDNKRISFMTAFWLSKLDSSELIIKLISHLENNLDLKLKSKEAKFMFDNVKTLESKEIEEYILSLLK